MKKNIQSGNSNKYRLSAFSLLVLLSIFTNNQLVAQNIISAFNTGEKNLNLALSYTHENFQEFYRGVEKMEIGVEELTTKSASLYAEYGISNRLDVLVNLPYISASSSNENLTSTSKLQDLSLHLKYALFNPDNSNPLRLTAGLGMILPVSDYDPLVPVTIGLHVFGVQMSAAALYPLGNGVFTELSASQIFRSEGVPDTFEATSKIGWSKNKFYGHLWYSKKETWSGFDLGDTGSTFQTLKTNFDKLGLYTSYRIVSNISASLGGGIVLNGRNVGKSYCLNTGLVMNLNTK